MEFRGNNGNPFPEKHTLSITYTDPKGKQSNKDDGVTTYGTEELARANFVGAMRSLPPGYKITSATLYPPQGEGAAINLLNEWKAAAQAS